MTVVIDASVAAKWLLPERDAEVAERLKTEELVAPPMFRLECANALIKRLRIGQLSRTEALFRLEEVKRLPVALRAIDEGEAFELAVALRHPVYDCAYLALARTLGARLVTADRRMRDAVEASERAGELLPLVSMLADYA